MVIYVFTPLDLGMRSLVIISQGKEWLSNSEPTIMSTHGDGKCQDLRLCEKRVLKYYLENKAWVTSHQLDPISEYMQVLAIRYYWNPENLVLKLAVNYNQFIHHSRIVEIKSAFNNRTCGDVPSPQVRTSCSWPQTSTSRGRWTGSWCSRASDIISCLSSRNRRNMTVSSSSMLLYRSLVQGNRQKTLHTGRLTC